MNAQQWCELVHKVRPFIRSPAGLCDQQAGRSAGGTVGRRDLAAAQLPITIHGGSAPCRDRRGVRGTRNMARLIFGFAIALAVMQQAAAYPIESNQIKVIDGDTITADGKTIRLLGFAPPEMRGAQCRAERDLGVKATKRVRDLIQAGALDYSPVTCSCPANTLGKWVCILARTCGRLKANGRDVGDILVAEGLAVPFLCDGMECPKAPKPWCKS
jgi:endonuclease YncB( thermonuclease family)